MVAPYMLDKSKIFGDIEFFQNLEKRSLLLMQSFIFDDVINKRVPGQHIMLESVNYFIDRHHFTMGIAGPDFNCMSCLELEILVEEACTFLLY